MQIGGQGIGPRTPFSDRLLARQGEATGARARELHQPRRDMLAARSLGIDQDMAFTGRSPVVPMPSVEQLDDHRTIRPSLLRLARQRLKVSAKHEA